MNRRIVLILATMMLIGAYATPVYAQSEDPPSQTKIHIVQRGDTLSSIAKRYNLTVDTITHVNGIPDPRQIYVGQRLIIPTNQADVDPTDTMPYVVQAGDTLVSIARRYQTTWQTLTRINDLLSPNIIHAGQVLKTPHPGSSSEETPNTFTGGAIHIVHPDDTLFRIALKYDVPPWVLATGNHIANPALIYRGQEITIPGEGHGMLPEPFASVEIYPLPVTQGSAMIIAVRATEPITLTNQIFEQKGYFAKENNVYYALVGIHVFTEPGLYEMELTATDNQERSTTINTSIVLEEGQFYYERIDVPAGRSNLLDPVRIAEDRARLDAARNTFTSERRWTIPFQRPCVGPISAYFGAHRSYNGGPYTSYHSGIDYRAPSGTPVHAPAEGVVILADQLALWGNTIVIDHGWGVLTGYAHLSEIDVEVGHQVARGAPIAKVGNTGLSTGSHLHWEVWINGTSVNGLQWLEELSPWPEVGWQAIGG